jgi:hypothetical protein
MAIISGGKPAILENADNGSGGKSRSLSIISVPGNEANNLRNQYTTAKLTEKAPETGGAHLTLGRVGVRNILGMLPAPNLIYISPYNSTCSPSPRCNAN